MLELVCLLSRVSDDSWYRILRLKVYRYLCIYIIYYCVRYVASYCCDPDVGTILSGRLLWGTPFPLPPMTTIARI